MGREFQWEDVDARHAILHGPEPYEIAAVIELVPAVEEGENGEWRVMSNTYESLNKVDCDVGITLEAMKRKTLIDLGSELVKCIRTLKQDHENVLSLLYMREEEDPYEWPEL